MTVSPGNDKLTRQEATPLGKVVVYVPFIVAPFLPWLPVAIAALIAGWVLAYALRGREGLTIAALATVGSLALMSLLLFTLRA